MRFTQPAYPTVFFSEKIFAKCNQCNGVGIVKTKLGKYIIPFPHNHKSTFSCTNCGTIKKDSKEWHGYFQGFLSISCGYCGSGIVHSTKPVKTTTKTTQLKCGVCKKEKEYQLKWYRYRKDKSIDPYFGLDLWLQVNFKSHFLWIYNLEHLKYLKEYVASKLREDNDRHKYSMITNLPQWIKSAKNRDAILKKLNILEKEIKRISID
ncbi:hypothetical protein [Xanthomarina gelatinilytica]|uniref:hypothetical protein n=1 Tax=Xanthomarina gelatinilytica TaxID=1137281 RepID=UPI003AA88EAB